MVVKESRIEENERAIFLAPKDELKIGFRNRRYVWRSRNKSCGDYVESLYEIRIGLCSVSWPTSEARIRGYHDWRMRSV